MSDTAEKVKKYAAAWNEADTTHRDALLAACWA